MALFQKKQPVSTTTSSPGSPAYDARIDGAHAAELSSVADRLQAQLNVHLFSDKSAAARVYSHAYDSEPSPLVQQMMGLGQSASLVHAVMNRTADQPFPGVELGPTPGVHNSPVEPHFGPGGYEHLTHHAHQVETRRKSRARFGH